MNLLPEQYKKELSFEAWRQFFVFFGSYGTMVGLVGVVLLLPSYFFLQLQIKELERALSIIRSGVEFRDAEGGRGRVADINRSIATMVQFESVAPKVEPVVSDIIARVTGGVAISQMQYARVADGTIAITLTGKAATRDDLIRFTVELQKNPLVRQEIKPQVNDLLRETDVPFILVFQVQP